MKEAVILIFSSVALAGCASSAQQNTTQTQTATVNSNISVQRSNDTSIVSSHSKEKNTPPVAPTSGKPAGDSSSGNSPMAKAIDVGEMTAGIEKAEKAYKAKSTDAKLKDSLAEAYFARAFALTDAAQYRAALGDFRKGLKLNPEAKEAKAMHDQIIGIFKSINREPPKEGEEPPPMPFNKG